MGEIANNYQLSMVDLTSTYKGTLNSIDELYAINDAKEGDYHTIGKDIYYRINNQWKHYDELFPKVVSVYAYDLEIDKVECHSAASDKYFNIILGYDELKEPEDFFVDEKTFKLVFEMGARWMVEQIYKNEIKSL